MQAPLPGTPRKPRVSRRRTWPGCALIELTHRRYDAPSGNNPDFTALGDYHRAPDDDPVSGRNSLGHRDLVTHDLAKVDLAQLGVGPLAFVLGDVDGEISRVARRSHDRIDRKGENG